MEKPVAIATIEGLTHIPAGSKVTFAGKVIRCWKEKGTQCCLLGDESGFILVQGQAVEHWQPMESYRIEKGLLKGALLSKAGRLALRTIALDTDSKIELLQSDIWTPKAPPAST